MCFFLLFGICQIISFLQTVWYRRPCCHVSAVHLESPVKLLVRAFPPVVAPEIEAGVAADGLLQHLEETYGYLVVGQFGRLVGNKAEGADVSSAARPLHVDIEHGIVHLPHYALASGEDGCVVVEEWQPEMDIVPFRRLVGDVSEEPHPLLAPVFDEIAQDFVLGHADSALAVAYVPEQMVEHGIAQRMVYQSAHGFAVSAERQSGGREEFPVAVVPEYCGAGLPLVEIALQLLRIPEFDMPQQCLVANGKELHRLHEIVAQPMVEAFFYTAQFLFILLGEG